MQRIRLYDLLNSELPQILGYDSADVPRISTAVNRSQERLLTAPEANDEGWFGGWAEMVFSVNRKHPYITTPRGVARLEAIDVCSRPVPLRNQFFEYMLFGDGRLTHSDRWQRAGRNWGFIQGMTRNSACTFTDIDNAPQQIQTFVTNPADAQPNENGQIPRIFVQGLDANGNIVYSQDGGITVEGEFDLLTTPYVLSTNTFNFLNGIQKDVTKGPVQVWQSDPTWGTSELLTVMEPTETTAWYRRYYISELPRNCCPSVRPVQVNAQAPKCGCPYPPKEYVQVTAIAKLDLIPVVAATDYCLIQSREAIIAECQSIRFSKFDDAASRATSASYHEEAIRILRGQRIHTEGKNTVSVSFRPFGSASLRRQRIGSLK